MLNKILVYVLLGLSALVTILYFAGVVGEDLLLYWAYALVAATLVLAVVVPAVDLIKNPKKLVKALIFAVVAAVLVAACYALSSPEVVGLNKELAASTTAASVKWTEAGIFGLYILLGLTVIAILFSEIKNALK